MLRVLRLPFSGDLRPCAVAGAQPVGAGATAALLPVRAIALPGPGCHLDPATEADRSCSEKLWLKANSSEHETRLTLG